jgi:aminodeoxyfutalosine deaminase
VTDALGLQLVERVIRKGVVLEMCPTSNVQTGAVGSLGEHPLRKFLEMGGRATVNSDDPGVCSTDMVGEYLVAARQLGLSLSDLETISRFSAEAIFLPAGRKAILLRTLAARLSELNASLEVQK